MNTLAQSFINRFNQEDYFYNPLAVSLKMIIASLSICDEKPIIDLKTILSYMYAYLCCSNIIIFDDTLEQIYIHNDEYPEVIDYVKEFIEEKIECFESNDSDPDHYVSSERFHLDCFMVKTENNSRYYIALLNNTMAEKGESEELILTTKAILYAIFSIYENTQRIIQLTQRDDLTGLWSNRMYQRAFEDLNSENKEITFITADLFMLKYVNDKFGHQNGNQYIITASKLLKWYFHDCVYRIGGDEFVIIAPKIEDIDKTFESINNTLAEMLHHMISKNTHFIINYGYVSGDTGKIPAKSFFNIADKNLSDNKAKTYEMFKIERRASRQ